MSEVVDTLRARSTVRGEMVLLLDGKLSENNGGGSLTLAAEVTARMQSEKLSEKDALKRVAKERGIGKSEAYREWQRTRH